MYFEVSDAHATKQTSKEDPRVTRVGRFIRRMSIDELPQLFNVPRRHDVNCWAAATCSVYKAEGKNLEELLDYYAVRHRVRPGLTGLAQVNGFRGELTSLEELQSRVDLDIEYIDKWDVWLDLSIIMRTILIVFTDPHAY